MATAFDADRIQARARDLIRARLGPEDVEQVARWYSSPLGKRIRELERKSGKPETYAAKQGNLATLVGAERLKRFERVEAAVQGAEAILSWLKHAGTAIQRTRSLVSRGVDLPLPPVTEQIAQMRPKIRRMSILTSADNLRDLTIEELDQYVSFVESPSGRRWYQAMWDALDLVLAKGMEEVMAAMLRIPK